MFNVGQIEKPYLIYLADIAHPKDGKTGLGLADWRPEWCVGQLREAGCGCDAGLPDMTIKEAAAAGARTFVVGGSPTGGELPAAWIPVIREAIENGLHVVSGLHNRLNSVPELTVAAATRGVALHDVRAPRMQFDCGTGERRSGRRILTVGTSTCVGKKYTALAIDAALRRKGILSDFRATGQTGLLISERGVVIDAVVADFIAGAAEYLSPAAAPDHWDVVEGQGSLFHPAYAGVTLGLIHGTQPDYMVLCHKPNGPDDFLSGEYVAEFMELHLRVAKLTNPNPAFIGISLNLAQVQGDEAVRMCDALQDVSGLPCVDPVRMGVDRLLLGTAY